MEQEPLQLDYVSRGRLNRKIGAPLDAPLPLRITLGAVYFLLWRVATAAAVGLFLAALAYGIHIFVAVLAGMMIFIGLPALAATMAQVRQRRSVIILGYLEQAVRLNLPLPRMLFAAQRSETSRTSKRLGHLRSLIEDGAPLELALPLATPEVSARTVGLITAGERLGSLRQTLMRLVKNPRDADDETGSRDSFARWYPLLMTLALSSLLLLIVFFVVPKIDDIYHDYGMRLPYATQKLSRIGRMLYDLDFLPLPIVFVAVVWVLGGAFRRVLSARQPASSGLFDRIFWYLPISHGLARDRGLADACYAMADALRAGYGLPRALDEAAMLRLNGVLRSRLRKWNSLIQGGAPADQAGRAARLPPLLCGMIGSGRGGDPAATMEFLANYYDSRFSRSSQLLRAASIPILALVFGGVVLFLASGTYLPLLNLMDQLNEKVLKVSK